MLDSLCLAPAVAKKRTASRIKEKATIYGTPVTETPYGGNLDDSACL